MLALGFMLFPILVEKNIYKAGIYLAVSFLAILFAMITRYGIARFQNGKQASLLFFRTMIVMYYLNAILFGIYLGVWSNPDRAAVTFMGILIVALFPFINPPSFNLGLTLGAMLIFSVSTILTKVPEIWVVDIADVLIAGIISIAFCWQVSMLRISLISGADELEKERDSYYNQSTIDELTQLKNRRDFTQTLQRFQTSFRSDDKWLWVAIMDVDYFKNYNDFYGHPMGDEVLRSIGRELNSLRDSTGVYTARIGGEEFALIRLEKEIAALDGIISQLQQKIYNLNISHEKSKVVPYVTISIGVYLMQCVNTHI
ncbi:MAG: diguanylate cyclase, partial [Treponema sp.]|nr:diguanylate cyclase [Treponema sp.]